MESALTFKSMGHHFQVKIYDVLFQKTKIRSKRCKMEKIT